MNLVDPNGEKIVMIQYHGDYPHAVFTERSQYDFDWLPDSSALAYHWSGGGSHPYIHPIAKGWRKESSSSIWIAKGQRVVSGSLRKRFRPKFYGEQKQYCRSWRDSKPLSRSAWKRKLPHWGYRFLPSPLKLPCGALNPFESIDAVEGDTVFCKICEKMLLVDEYDYDGPCEHIHWCDEHGMHSGLGCDDPCSCQTKKKGGVA